MPQLFGFWRGEACRRNRPEAATQRRAPLLGGLRGELADCRAFCADALHRQPMVVLLLESNARLAELGLQPCPEVALLVTEARVAPYLVELTLELPQAAFIGRQIGGLVQIRCGHLRSFQGHGGGLDRGC
ncbi:MAG: hypothetical protein ACK55I_43655 [bacterium]